MITIVFSIIMLILIIMAYFFGASEKEYSMKNKLFKIDKECREYKDKLAAERFYDRVFNEFL